MSVYAKEKAEHLRAAFSSLAAMSDLDAMDELLLVLDGPIGSSLSQEIEHWRQRLRIRTVALSENAGLAVALNTGLKEVRSPWVMRFDTDDICLRHRVSVQLPMMASGHFDLIGSQIHEFMMEGDDPHQARVVPVSHAEIVKYSKRRNPFNHMTVCFRTELALKLGGYPCLPYMEDYALWVAMLRDGAKVGNSSEVLVHARIGSGMYERRGGLEYAHCEVRLQRFLYRIGHKSAAQAVLHGVLRGAVFLSPVRLRQWVYENLLRS
jgi:glycosyltransferase involved in cell wall biosynthesis